MLNNDDLVLLRTKQITNASHNVIFTVTSFEFASQPNLKIQMFLKTKVGLLHATKYDAVKRKLEARFLLSDNLIETSFKHK